MICKREKKESYFSVLRATLDLVIQEVGCENLKVGICQITSKISMEIYYLDIKALFELRNQIFEQHITVCLSV